MSLRFAALDRRPFEEERPAFYPTNEGMWVHYDAGGRLRALILKEGADCPSGHTFALYELQGGFGGLSAWVRLTHRSTLEKAIESHRQRFNR